MLSIRFIKSALTLFLSIAAIALSQSALAKGKIKLINTCHDGYCFYHAINALTQHSPTAQALRDELSFFINNQANTEGLNELLQTELIASNIVELRHQIARPIQLGDRSNWPSQAHVVAMSLMLNAPILVLVVNDHLISHDSFLVTPNGILPFDSLINQDQESSVPVPWIQLVLIGENWLALSYQPEEQPEEQTEQQPEQQAESQSLDPLIAYISQLNELFSRLPHGFTESDSLVFEGDANQMTGAGSFSQAYNPVLTSYDSVKTWLQNMVTRFKASLRPNYKGCRTLSASPNFDLSEDEFLSFQTAFRTQSRFLFDPLIPGILGDSMQDYLQYTGFELNDILAQLDPEQQDVWPMLEELRAILPQLVAQVQLAQTFGAIAGLFFEASQKTAMSPAKGYSFPEQRPRLPSGMVHPDRISVAQWRCPIVFDRDNPVHLVFFTLYVIAKIYDIANQGLTQTINALTLASKQGQRVEISPGIIMMSSDTPPQKQEAHLRKLREKILSILGNLNVVIHALGQRYFCSVWQPGRYVCITIEDGDFIVFHSDDYMPRGGWKHLWPEGKKKKSRKK